jgi:uncharacterized membrane protein YfcA
MSASVFAILALAVTCAYVLKAITGFGTALILVPALALVFDIKEAIAIAALGDVVSSAILSHRDHSHLSFAKLKEISIGLFFGTILGVIILNTVNTDLLKIMLGVFIAVYLIIQQVNPTIKITSEWFRKALGYLFGFIGGVCGGIFNTNGPAIFVYVRSAFPSKEVIRANIFFLFLLDSIWRTGLFTINGLITWSLIGTFSLLVVPSMLLGLYIGDKIDKRLKHEHYSTLSKLVLIVSGIKLLIR